MELYIGLMSGTSADGINAALVDIQTPQIRLVDSYYYPFKKKLREQILGLCHEGDDEINRLGELDVILGKAFADAAINLLQQQGIEKEAIRAIGSHGQTVRHQPNPPYPYTIQIGDPNTISAETGIVTVADFRRKDLAYGGQGAPLVPAFHQTVFASKKTNRAVVNIGGIANITVLCPGEEVIGFDTGPGDSLMDAWIHYSEQKNVDEDGIWAKAGEIQADLLEQLLTDNYFAQPAPKSTGREHFNLAWLEKHMFDCEHTFAPVDVQATLAELTAVTIINSIKKHMNHGEILLCGGGVHNKFLYSRIVALAHPHFTVESTAKYGLDPDWVEAAAFAWLAQQTIKQLPGNLPSVTGAKNHAILGGIYFSG